MKRINRLNLDINYKNGVIGLLDLFDNYILSIIRCSQDEYNKLSEILNDEEINLFINLIDKKDWKSKKELLILIENYYKKLNI